MPRLFDKAQIRPILETDRPWAAYALADLEPGFFEHTSWWCAEGAASALALVYSAFGTPVLICVGPAPELRPILNEIDATLGPHELYLVVQPDVIPLLAQRYRISGEKEMLRMVLDPQRYRQADAVGAVRLGPSDVDAVRRLFDDGADSGESPDWFLPDMLAKGIYYGILEDEDLVAVAGTHIVAEGEGVGCLGNIYTRRDRRGRGLGTRVTGAVTGQLVSMALPTIVLNVQAGNAAAIRVYERLGFRRYCGFVEAAAVKLSLGDAGEPRAIDDS